jgi:hypothetical protein
MTVHTYPSLAMSGDYLRAVAGVIGCLARLAAVPLAPLAMAMVSGAAALFGAFGIRTLLRHCSRIEVTETALSASGLLGVKTIPWAALDGMRLAYYAIRRDGGGGWMQLVLRAGRSKVSPDSRIEGFALLVARAAGAAAARRLPLDRATLANLEALGLAPVAPAAAAGRAVGRSA